MMIKEYLRHGPEVVKEQEDEDRKRIDYSDDADFI